MAVKTDIRTFAAIGTGVIGSGWICRALAHGLDVVVWDPAPGAPERLRASVANAWPALERVGLAPGADPARLRFAATIAECVADADFIQESAPEREALKLELHEQISRGGEAGRDHRVVDVRAAAERLLCAGHPSGALRGRPSVQSGLPAAARRGARRRAHVAGGRRSGDDDLSHARHAAAARTQGGAGLHRGPAARGVVARGAASRRRRRRDDRRDRRRDPLRRGHPLVVPWARS